MTTTISKHDLQQLLLQQQHQQQIEQHQQQQQLQLQQLQQQHKHQLQQQQQQQQRSSILFKTNLINNTSNPNLLLNNTVNNIINTQTTNTNTSTTITTANTTTTTTTTSKTLDNKTRLDSVPKIIQIDSLNNNNFNLNSRSLRTTPTPTPTITTTTTATHMVNIQPALNNNGGIGATSSHSSPDDTAPTNKPQKRRSLLNFKSLDFHIKSLYSGLLNGNPKNNQSQISSMNGGSGAVFGIDNANGSALLAIETPPSRPMAAQNRMPPYFKIDAVDCEESANLLLDYPQSPYSSRRNSSHDDNRSSSQLLHINPYDLSRSHASSPSPYFLSPYAMDSSGNIRRSSTSDITSCKRSGTSSGRESRRPSTSDLLRRARERRGSEARMGRSVSHGGLPRGGGYRGGGGGGRRTSMAF